MSKNFAGTPASGGKKKPRHNPAPGASPEAAVSATHAVPKGSRLVSLDVFRGLTMLLLIGESSRLYHHLQSATVDLPWAHYLAQQLEHHPWHGLRFWDLIQPFFMFIVGVAMACSYSRRWQRGDAWRQTFWHALYRGMVLLVLGMMLECTYAGRVTLGLWNVLAQLSVTTLAAFLLMRFHWIIQILGSLAAIGATEALYRLCTIPGYNEPFTPDHNFGAYVDMLLMGRLSRGHWVAFNCVPTIAHTVWGVLAGKVLLSSLGGWKKIAVLAGTGVVLLGAGYALDQVTPIIKRICTSSFVLVSGGWAFVTLALFYGVVDLLRFQRPFAFCLGFGANAILIYLFAETAGSEWFYGFVQLFTNGFFGRWGELAVGFLTSGVVLLLEWAACQWLYHRGAIVRI